MDAKEISEKAAKAKAARSGWAADMVSRVVAAGESLIAKREQVRTASAPERKTPFQNNQAEAVSRLDQGAAASGPRDIRSIAAMDKDRQISQAVARARQMVEKKIGGLPISGPDIHYLRAEISRWDDHSGQPQTGRISFQIPFHGPHGDPRTIYASVDLVMGDLMEPKTFSDGLNKVYAFDTSGIKEMFQGQDFDVVHQPKVVPEIKYTGPEFHAPDGQPGAVAAVNSPLIFRKASGEMSRQASGEKPSIAREGLVRSLSKEAAQIGQPITPEQAKNPEKKPPVRTPANALSNYPSGAESNTDYPQGDQAPGHQTMARAELRELNFDGTIRGVVRNDDVKTLIELAHVVTYGGHDYVVEVWDDGKLVERIATVKARPGGNLRLATAIRVMEAGKKKHEQPGGEAKSHPGHGETAVCKHCGQKLVDGCKESGLADMSQYDWMTEGGDFGCDENPKSGPDGVDSHEAMPKGRSQRKGYDHVGAIIEFENGSLDEQGILDLFQYLVDTGLAWSLQGSYGRAAKSLLDQGLIQPANSDRSDAYGNTVPGKPRDDQGLHEDSPSLEDEGKNLGSYESAAKGLVRTASLSKAISDLNILDVRMVNFRDLVMLCKQHGQESNLSFDSASKELAKAGIVLYRTAGSGTDNAMSMRLAHAKRQRLAAPPMEAPAAELPNTPGMNEQMGPSAPGGGTPGGEGTAEIAPPAGLDPVEFREFQALLDEYNNQWETTHQRELNNIKNGNAPHLGIDYTDLQLLYDKIEAFQQAAKQGKTDEMSATPSDLANQDKTKPAEVPPANPVPPGEAAGGGSTIIPEKGKGLAGVAPRMTRAAIEQALSMKEQALTVTDGAETVVANTANIDSVTGGGSGIPKSATLEVDPELSAKITEMGGDPNNPNDPKTKQALTLYTKASHSQKFPEVCKNCKSLVVPAGYSPLREFKHTRLPFCGAAKEPGVGFLHAYFRDCLGYDPIIKDIAQKVESKAPESEQTEKDTKKGQKPIMERAGEKKKKEEAAKCDSCGKKLPKGNQSPWCDACIEHGWSKKAAALPSAESDAVREKDSQTGAGLDIRKWCESNGHYAPAGDVHPAHDWCTLWNTAVDNLVKLPSGAVVPRSMSGQSAESNGEGGPHQFGNTSNQAI